MAQIINAASAAFAIAAAICWFLSTLPKVPTEYSSPYSAPPPELDDLASALAKQSRRNAWGAGCAGIAAILQVVAQNL